MTSRRFLTTALFSALFSLLLFAQTDAKKPAASGEAKAAQRLEAVRKNPLLLREYLMQFPKGADLHNHLSGAIYAESYIRWGAEMPLCVDTRTFAYLPAKKDDAGKYNCPDPANQRPGKDALTDSVLYRNVIDAFSMRFFPGELNGEYHFFDTFGKFGAISGARGGEMLAEVMSRAASQNEHYLELMVSLDGGVASSSVSAAGAMTGDDFAGYRDKLLANGLANAMGAGRKILDDSETRMRAVLHCGQTDADPGCGVTIRYVFQVSRATPRERVFAQCLAGFMMSAGPDSDRRVVGINLVQPEDAYISMHDFDDHMAMLDWLHSQYPKMKVTLHAGELAFGLVLPTDLGQHVRKSVEKGHALRIGHGVDVMYDTHAAELLAKMAKEHIAVEINLTSNDAILGVKGKDHPLPQYLKAGVPVVISTDDEGVSRSDISHEYQRAVEEHGLDYAQIKRISRNTLEFSFLAGNSIWLDHTPGKAVKECADIRSKSCEELATSSDKARAQRDLELRFLEFEK